MRWDVGEENRANGDRAAVNRVRSRVNRSASTPHTSTSILVAKMFLSVEAGPLAHPGHRPSTAGNVIVRVQPDNHGVLLRFTYAIEVSRQAASMWRLVSYPGTQSSGYKTNQTRLMLYDHRGYLIIA